MADVRGARSEEVGHMEQPRKRMRLSQDGDSDQIESGPASPISDSYEGESLGAGVPSMDIFTSGDSGFNDLTCSLEGCSTSESPGNSGETSRKNSNDDEDDVASSLSSLSNLSGLSDLAGQEWKQVSGPMSWLNRQMMEGANPRDILQQLVPSESGIPPELDDISLWKIVISIVQDCASPKRARLTHICKISDVVQLLSTCKKILVVTGAGVSVSCGIPDFRSKDGVYARLATDFPDLPDPQAMFDVQYFERDPRPFFKFAREIFPGKFVPSTCHRFIKLLERKGILLRNYTQNIDTLEKEAGIERVIECHGSFASATCRRCGHKVSSERIRGEVENQRIPLCPLCHPCEPSGGISPEQLSPVKSPDDDRPSSPLGILKPDIVFFGEGLPDEFHSSVAVDREQCDLLIVIGSSLKVRPVALIPSSIPPEVPQILINREPLPHLTFDVELLGECDVITAELCRRIGWEFQPNEAMEEVEYNGQLEADTFGFVSPNRYIFPGAEVPPDDEAGTCPSSSSSSDTEN